MDGIPINVTEINPVFFAGHVSSYDSKDQSYLWMA